MANETFMEVRFDIFCQSCKHDKKQGFEDPCNECLEHGMNRESIEPVNYDPKFEK